MSDPDNGPTGTPAARAAKQPWRMQLTILTLAHVVGTLHSTTILVMSPAIKSELGLSFTEFGFLVTAYSVGQVTGALPAGRLTDRIGVGRALVVAHVILLASAMTLIQAHGLTLALIAMLIAGWGYSIINPATAKGVFETFSPQRRATAMGVKQTGVPLGGVLAALSGSLVAIMSWRYVTAGVAAATVLGGLACLVIAERPAPREAIPGDPADRSGRFTTILRDANYGRFVLSNFLYNFGQYNFFGYLTLFMREVAAVSQELAGLCYGTAQVASVTARLGWGAVSDFLFKGRRKALTVGIGIAAVVLIAAMTLVEPRWGLASGLLLSALLGLTLASYAPLMQTMSVEAVPPRLAGSAVGYNMIGTSLGAIVGPPVFGYVIDATGGFAGAWLLTALIVACGVATLVFGFKERG
jgi:predicted MFS family arabinose efflux permease